MTVAVFRFDAASHRYFLGDEELPSVSRIIRPLQDFSSVPSDVLAMKAALGTAVHLATELDDAGDLDEESLDDAVVPYLAAWRAFRSDTGAEFHAIESRLYHPQLRYAGTLDRLATLRGRGTWLLDIKSGASVDPWVGVQLAAYRLLVEADGRRVDSVGAVQLCPDGTYRLHKFGHPDDTRCFHGLLAVYHWRRKHD